MTTRTLRLPDKLNASVKIAAEAAGLSVNTYIATVLNASLTEKVVGQVKQHGPDLFIEFEKERPMDFMTAHGWLTERERKTLFGYAAQVPARGQIVNIGVEHGASVVCLIQGRVTDDVDIYALDLDMSKWGYGKQDNVHLWGGDSVRSGNDWSLGGIDLLFVDGDHSRQGVLDDANAWSTHVKENGIIIFHDAYDWPPAPPKTIRPPAPEVSPAIDDWLSEWDGMAYTEASPNGFIELPSADSMRIFMRV